MSNTGVNPNAIAPGDGVDVTWTYETGRTEPPVVNGGSVYITHHPDPDTYRLTAVSVSDGTERWSVDIGLPHRSPTVRDGRVFVGSNEGVSVFDAVSGDVEWSALSGRAVSPVVTSGTVYAAGTGGEVVAIDTDGGDPEWSTGLNGEQILSTPAYADDTLVVGTQKSSADETGGAVYALNSQDGQREWRHDSGPYSFSAPAIRDNTVVAANKRGVVRALDLTNGEEQWRVEFDTEFSCPSALTPDTAFVGGQDGGLHALSLSDGTERWSVDTSAFFNAGPTVAGETVYFEGGDAIYAVDAGSGEQQWQSETPCYGVIISDGSIYTGSSESGLRRLS
jgi:outer membrane protein assembly factor BamB